jgi:excinuclease ABC subunit A
VREQADLAALVPDASLSLRQGALAPWRARGLPRALESWARAVGLDLHLPWKELPPRARDEVLYGDDDTFVGVLSLLEQRGRGRSRGDDDDDDDEPEARARFVAPCDDCGGTRLRPEARCVKISGRHIGELSGLPIAELQAFLRGLTLPSRVKPVVERVRHEIVSRLAFLESVGLPYLSLGRAASTLSGGEGQRVRLATQLGSSLVGVLYVLDEPSVGLHPSDAQKLLQTLRTLVQRGNSVLVVEHDLDTIRAADWVVDLGPAAGILGGRVVAQGTPASLWPWPESVTGPWLAGRRTLGVPSKRRNPSGSLDIVGARRNNLKDLTVSLPLGCLLAVTGVSGSGKSSLILGTLVPLLRAHLQGVAPPSLPVDRIDGLAQVDRLVAVDATPLGRTPRSSPATYMGIFAQLREVFSAVPEARARGWKAGRFSFNVKGGRCETCQGEGVLRVEMHFLPDVLVPCEACGGSRYEPETLHVRFRGHSIADVLGMTVDEASGVFDNLPRVRDLLLGLRDVGLGYLHLGQPASTLSGGEAQRVKLARELSRRGGQRTLYVLDEPTTGLHMADIELLLHLLERLVEQGHSVLVIEHNLELIKRADRVLDLGPEGGDRGGRLVAQGTPEEVARAPDSLTGVCLREALQQCPPGLEGRAKGR